MKPKKAKKEKSLENTDFYYYYKEDTILKGYKYDFHISANSVLRIHLGRKKELVAVVEVWEGSLTNVLRESKETRFIKKKNSTLVMGRRNGERLAKLAVKHAPEKWMLT